METHLLVGGLGFIGEHLARNLLEKEYRVVILARASSITRKRKLAEKMRKLGAIIVISKHREIEEIEIEELNPSVIYHLAGKPGGPRKVQWEAHVGLVRKSIEASLKNRSRLIYVSSIAVAADTVDKPPGSTINEEDVPPGNNGVYETFHSETKAEGERIVSQASRIRWSIVRPALVYGPGHVHSEIKLLSWSIKFRLKPSSVYIPVVNVVDVAEILSIAGEGKFDYEVVHAVSNYTLTDVASRLCKGKRCLPLRISNLLRIGRIAPRSSKVRLAWSIARKRYRYTTVKLRGYEWRIEPVI